MNKKFSTLLAGFLLAGGVLSPAMAEKFAEAAQGTYYKVVRNLTYNSSTSKWVNVTTNKVALDVVGNEFKLTTNSDDVWTITGDATKGYTLKSLNGKVFTFDGSNKVKVGDTGSTSNAVGEQLQMLNGTWISGGKLVNGSAALVKGATYSSTCIGSAFELVETPLSYVKNAENVALSNGLVAYIYANDTKVGTAKYVISYDADTKAFSLSTLADGEVVSLKGIKNFKVAQKVGNSYLFAVDGDDTRFIGLDANGELTVVNDVTTASLFTFREVEIATLSAKDMIFFEKNGFSMSIKGQDADGKWTVALEDDFFTGHLTPMNWDAAAKKFVAATESNDDMFYLKNANGKYVVAYSDLAEGYENAYQFVEVAEDDLKRDILKSGEQKYFGQYTFYYSTATTDKKKVELIQRIEMFNHDAELQGELGRLDFKSTPYLAIEPESNTSIDLLPIQIKLGSDLIADWKEVLTPKFFTVEDITKDSKNGFMVANCGSAWWEGNEKAGNVLEKQWALTFANGEYVFKNRENPNATFTLPDALYKTDTENVYNVTVVYDEGTQNERAANYTLAIKPVEGTKATDGYKRLADVKNHKFHIGYWSGTYGDHAWLTENHEGTDNHQIGLTTEQADASVWTAIEYNKAYKEWEDADNNYETATQASDSIYVISSLGYINKDGNQDYQLDTLAVVAYSFVNQYGESLYWNKTYTAEEVENPDKYALREDNDHYNIRLVGAQLADNNRYFVFNGCGIKTYAGDAANGLLSNIDLYTRTENDLFDVVETERAMYRTVINPLDTISIFRADNEKSILFEDGEFLGMENLAQFPSIAPGMVADTAYVRYNTYRPQYLLVVDPKVTSAEEDLCDICGLPTCEHSKSTTGSVEGRFLVNLKDTAIVWHNANKHNANNPYINTEKYYRLGFVQATHKDDQLIIATDKPTAKDTIFVGDENFNVAKFAFKYVDQEAGSFKIETADYKNLNYGTKAGELKENSGWVKWMNGVVVVVDEEKNADIFNMDEEFEGQPTANEDVEVAEVSIIAANGSIIVKGAAGKTVAISNILGQTIANAVVSSDNETIAVPAGIAVVAVEGEEAVKVVVK